MYHSSDCSSPAGGVVEAEQAGPFVCISSRHPKKLARQGKIPAHPRGDANMMSAPSRSGDSGNLPRFHGIPQAIKTQKYIILSISLAPAVQLLF
jgi:hypothetical protein